MCHIHLYFPFTTGHLNHIRIYYHHADSAPADNTNHDKMEQWLHKHPSLVYHIIWAGLDRRSYLWSMWSSIYMDGLKISLHLCPSLTCVCYYPIQTIDINSGVCVYVRVCAFNRGSIHHSAVGVPNQSLVRRDLCCNASNQQTFTVKYDFINRRESIVHARRCVIITGVRINKTVTHDLPPKATELGVTDSRRKVCVTSLRCLITCT